MPETHHPYYNSLDLSFEHAWAELERGTKDRRSLFHTPALATCAADGRPSIRTVVLRGVSREHGTLRINSDRRSAKVGELAGDARCGMHFYDPSLKVQLRLDGSARLHDDSALAEAAWTGSRQMSRRCYTQNVAPGAVIDDPSATARLDGDAERAGRENFCVILVTIARLEWLYLHSRGHRRAEWRCDAGRWTGCWLAP